jgi:Co/Zn/Cd efflux system component
MVRIIATSLKDQTSRRRCRHIARRRLADGIYATTAKTNNPDNMPSAISDTGLGRVVRRVALLNLGYFGVEFVVAVTIGSVSLFADSIDFLEDASINLLIAIALGWTA